MEAGVLLWLLTLVLFGMTLRHLGSETFRDLGCFLLTLLCGLGAFRCLPRRQNQVAQAFNDLNEVYGVGYVAEALELADQENYAAVVAALLRLLPQVTGEQGIFSIRGSKERP